MILKKEVASYKASKTKRSWTWRNGVIDVSLGLNKILSNYDLVGTPSHKCDAAMPKQSLPRSARWPVYWWYPEVVGLTASCLKASRRMRRTRTDEGRIERSEVYKVAKLIRNVKIKAGT